MPNLFAGPGPRPGTDNSGPQPELAHGIHHVVPAGTTLYSSTSRLFWSNHNFIDFTNNGTLWNIAPENTGAVLAGFYIFNFFNNGLIVSEAPNGNATAVSVGGSGDYFENRGSIYGIANGNAAALEHWGGPGVFVHNYGLLAAYAPQATAPGAGGGGVGSALGIALYNGGDVRNEADAAILAEGLTATAVLMSSGSIGNFGRIEALTLDSSRPSYGIGMGGLDHQQNILVNYGLIRADIAWSSYGEHPVFGPRGRDIVTNDAIGRMFGDIETGRGDDQVINAGLIDGDIRLGDGADLFDASAGTWSGVADLGWDDDLFIGSVAGDVGKGNRGRDTLDGGLGNDLLLGGAGADRLIGGSGNDGLYGESGDDILVLSEGDRSFGGEGNDRIEAHDLRFALASGGAGKDTLFLDIAGLRLDLAAIAASGRVQSIERLALRDSQQVAVRAGDVATLAGATFEVDGTRDNGVVLIGSWTEQPTINQAGGVFRTFVLGGETVLVRMGVSVTVGASAAGFTGLETVAGGSAAPDAAAVPGAFSDPVMAFVAERWVQEPYTLIEADEVWQSANVPVTWGVRSDTVLENRGVISMTTSSDSTLYGAMQGSYYGLIINWGTIRATATGPLTGTAAIAPMDRARVENHGLIEAVSVGGRATGAVTSFDMEVYSVLLNYGTIRASSSTGTAIAAAVNRVNLFEQDPVGANYGLIEATGGAGTIALQLLGGGLFVNRADIVARNSAASGAQDAIAVTLNHGVFNNSRLDNYGTVAGVVAIQAFGALSSVRNVGLITGEIRLGTGADLVTNTGEIRGAVLLGAGSDIYWAVPGVQQGAVAGGDGADGLFGTEGADSLDGGADDDILLGGGGADQLTGGSGRDVFVYGRVTDSGAAARDTIADFLSGTDRIDLTALAVQSVSIQADGGFSVLDVITAGGTLSVRVSGALTQADLVIAGASTLTGTAGPDTLLAAAGGSSLSGGGSNDLLIGQAGNDRLDGGAGENVLRGGTGNDSYVVRGVGERVHELPGGGVDTIEYDGPGERFFLPDEVENALGLSTVILFGNDLANRLTGSAGDDDLSGGRGNDVLIGGGGADLLRGDSGADRLTGGGGADRFVYWLVSDSRDGGLAPDGPKILIDVITDFTTGEDRIDLFDIDANPAGGGTSDSFVFLGAGAFTGQAGQLRTTFAEGVAHIYVDIDGDRVADMHIMAHTAAALTASDFIL